MFESCIFLPSWQCVQMMSGLLSFGIGIIFAVTQELETSLSTLFRVFYLNGLIVSSLSHSVTNIISMVGDLLRSSLLQSIFAGVLSVLLSKYPQLLQVSVTLFFVKRIKWHKKNMTKVCERRKESPCLLVQWQNMWFWWWFILTIYIQFFFPRYKFFSDLKNSFFSNRRPWNGMRTWV